MTFPRILFDLVGLFLLLATLPLTLELLVLSIAAIFPTRSPRTTSAGPMRLIVVVPAHNEERLIAACVQSLLASPEAGVEVLVIAHNCEDRTAEIAAEAGARVLALDGPGGKGLALDHGFRAALAAGADAVLVIDADSVVSPNLTDAVKSALFGGAQALQVRYQAANGSANQRTSLAAVALTGMNVLRPRGRARLGLSCGIFGNGFALSSETLRRVPYTANSLVEDLEYHLRLVKSGIRVEFLDHAAVFGEMPEKSAAAGTQRARWEGGRALMRRQWSVPLLKLVARGHLRSLEPLLDLRSLPLATQVILLILASFVPAHWLTGYAVVALLGVLLYLAVSVGLSPSPGKAAASLMAAPIYILWKLMLIPRTRLAARRDATWVRTARNADASTGSHKN